MLFHFSNLQLNLFLKDYVYKFLTEKGVTGTPVVTDGNKYKGIITIKDIAKKLIL